HRGGVGARHDEHRPGHASAAATLSSNGCSHRSHENVSRAAFRAARLEAAIAFESFSSALMALARSTGSPLAYSVTAPGARRATSVWPAVSLATTARPPCKYWSSLFVTVRLRLAGVRPSPAKPMSCSAIRESSAPFGTRSCTKTLDLQVSGSLPSSHSRN